MLCFSEYSLESMRTMASRCEGEEREQHQCQYVCDSGRWTGRTHRVEHGLGERLGKERLARAGRSAEEERRDRPVLLAEARPVEADSVRDGLDGLGLADERARENLLHLEQLLLLRGHQPASRDRRPAGDDLGNVGLGDDVGLGKLARLLLLGLAGFELLETLLKIRNRVELEVGGRLEVLPTLGVDHFGLQRINLLPDIVDFVAARLLGLVLGPHRRQLVLDVLERLLGDLEPLARDRVLLALERMDLDPDLELLALEVVERLGPSLARNLDARRCLVDQVDRAVGQPALSEVLLGELGGEDEGAVEDADAVMDRVLFRDATEDGLRDGGRRRCKTSNSKR